MQKKPMAVVLENAIAALDRVIEMNETLLQEFYKARSKLQNELSQLTPTQSAEAFRRASETFKKP